MVARSWLVSPYLFLIATLLSGERGDDVLIGDQYVIGQSSSSLNRLKDVDNKGKAASQSLLDTDHYVVPYYRLPSNNLLVRQWADWIPDGGFFVFGDISVRKTGWYRLRFSLFNQNK